MTEPLNPDLMALATPYALHALTDSEHADPDAAVTLTRAAARGIIRIPRGVAQR